MWKKKILYIYLLIFSSLLLYAVDVVKNANEEFLTLEETIKLAEKDAKNMVR